MSQVYNSMAPRQDLTQYHSKKSDIILYEASQMGKSTMSIFPELNLVSENEAD